MFVKIKNLQICKTEKSAFAFVQIGGAQIEGARKAERVT
jgi:hypothetical protein